MSPGGGQKHPGLSTSAVDPYNNSYYANSAKANSGDFRELSQRKKKMENVDDFGFI